MTVGSPVISHNNLVADGDNGASHSPLVSAAPAWLASSADGRLLRPRRFFFLPELDATSVVPANGGLGADGNGADGGEAASATSRGAPLSAAGDIDCKATGQVGPAAVGCVGGASIVMPFVALKGSAT